MKLSATAQKTYENLKAFGMKDISLADHALCPISLRSLGVTYCKEQDLEEIHMAFKKDMSKDLDMIPSVVIGGV